MTALQRNNPLHGVTLEVMLRELVDRFGWEGLARDIPINCFRVDPSMTSALKYLRKAPRARAKFEAIYTRVMFGRSA
ncbi:MAG: VF530 family protein [Candidatus Eisenbacteria bacterium]